MRTSVLLLPAFLALAAAQNLPLHPVPRFPMPGGSLRISGVAQPLKPFTVAGEHGGIFGQQDGAFEAWVFPVKVLSAFRITADLADYPVPIELNPLAAAIDVAPERTTITYSHAAFTVKQHMFVPRDAQTNAAPIVLFEIASVRPLQLTFRFQPEMLRMWPAPNFGRPGAEWVKQGGSGYYILHTDNPEFSGAVAIPRAIPGILPPYQERPQTYPLELKLSFDPKKDSDFFFPLLIAAGDATQLAPLNDRIPDLYSRTASYWAHFFDDRLTAETPDARFNDAMRWAAVAIDQAHVKFHDETGLVAGYYSSGDSARPGYGWFFGRDTLWTLYAVHGYGDFALSRAALEFLIRRQRADGKIMHEFSQTADLVDWKATPYFYAAADSTPLFVMTMEDYVNTSGDLEFLRKHWTAVKSAYGFTRAHDSDGDGIYENTEGTGWVESWPPAMPHQEIYLGALDQQSSASMARLAGLMHDDALARLAGEQSKKIREKLEPEYFDASSRFYAFSRNADGTTDKTATIYPAVAWWTGGLSLPNAGAMFSRWASHEFSTDWGTRDLSGTEAMFDPISYHQGSVWPLFTGWVSLAEYRAGRALSGYAHLMQNADLSYAQDLGAVTELLSGEFFQPLGRSSSHQTWSSAMVLTPALRGLFGLDWDALHHTLRLAPHLPASWSSAKLRHVPIGDSRVDLEFRRESDHLVIQAHSEKPVVLCLVPQSAAREDCRTVRPELRMELPPVEIEIPHGLPEPGSRTGQLKVLDEQLAANRLTITLEAPGGSVHDLPLRINRPSLKLSGAELAGDKLRLRFRPGAGYQREVITLKW
ncbi:MAG: glycogen debranching protein [Acidobacteriia bacterium]|nr:glycogen debranching protein [Terriglobia bacterium]